jgi:hypothetical protein
MGYDLACRGEHLDVEAAREVAHAAGYDDVQAWQNYDKLQTESGSYFRANIFSMGTLREVMMRLDALSLDSPPRFPDALQGVTEPNHAQKEMLAKWQAAESEDGLIPIWKLGSNDGWIVTPSEIRHSLEHMKGWVPKPEGDVDLDYWIEWIAFLRHTAKHHGFQVW